MGAWSALIPGLGIAESLVHRGKPSVYTPGTSPASQVQGYDPNAPLSSLLAGAGQNQNTFGAGLYARKAPDTKLQYLSDILNQLGIQNTNIGTAMLGKPLDYWQNLLKPPTRTGLLEQEAPVVSSVIGQYSTGKKALGQQARGGGTAATAANLPFEESGQITNLLQQQLSQQLNVLQPEAAKAITGIADTLSSLGLSELGLSSQDLQTLLTGKIASSGQSAQALGQAGQGVGELISMLLMGGA